MRLTTPAFVLLFVALASSCQCSKASPTTLLVEPARLDFGKFAPARKGDLELSVTNPSKAAVAFKTTIEADDRGAFSVVAAPAQLASGGTAAIKIRYTAGQRVGPDTGMVVLTFSGGVAEVPLSGEVVSASGASCGDSVVGQGETCDPPSSCSRACVDDGDKCTLEALKGSADTCDLACAHTDITSCVSNDGCCPVGCTSVVDNDCSSCGNGKVDPGETCDPVGLCPTSCNDDVACTTDTLMGAAVTCDAKCSHSPVAACVASDGCCPSGCTPANDNDCGVCGNGTCESVETCATCPGDCGVTQFPSRVSNSCVTQTTSYFAPKMCTPEMVVIGVYEGDAAHNRTIEVNINRTSPMTLVLSSYEEVHWLVRAVPDAKIDQIILSGFAQQQLAVGFSRPFALVSRSILGGGGLAEPWLGCGYKYPTDQDGCDTNKLMSEAQKISGYPATLFTGCYTASSFTID